MVFLFAAGIVVPLVRQLRISPVFGFLLVGLAIGPHGLARFVDAAPWLSYFLITDLEGVRPLAELGVVFLLFIIGLELSLDRLWAMRHLVFGLGGAQIVLTGSLIAVIASFFENTLAASVVLGASFALSSTAIVMQLLSENRRLGTSTGHTTFAILLCQDLAVLPILFLVGAFAAQSNGPVLGAFAWAIGQALIAVAAILSIGRLIIRPVFRFVGSTASREMFLAFVLLVIVGTAIGTQQAGMSMALGAFLAGLLFSETEYRHEIQIDIEPFKGLLLGLFFVTVGMSIDLGEFAAKPVWLMLSVLGLYLIKCPIVYVLARWFGQPTPVALEAGLLLGQGGEFGFLVIGLAYGLDLLPNETAQFMLIVIGLTMIATPPVSHFARRIARALEERDADRGLEDAQLAVDLSGHVIVVGYGRIGQMLGSVLDGVNVPHVGLDIDARLVARYHADGAGVFFGDARRPDILRRFGVDRAAALVVTMDSPEAAEQVVGIVRRNWPQLVIYARARDRAHAARLKACGASDVIPETIEASLQLSEIVLMGVDVPDEAARNIINERRQAERATLDEKPSVKPVNDAD